MADIKESLELLGLISTIAECLAEAKKDGVINWMDLPKFAPIIVAAKKAIEGSEFIDDEIKDLSAEESQVLAKASLEAGLKLIEAVIKK